MNRQVHGTLAVCLALEAMGCAATEATSQSENVTEGAPAEAVPYAAVLRSWKNQCTGLIVAPQVAMTAAHCTPGWDEDPVEVTVPSLALTRQVVEVARIRDVEGWPQYGIDSLGNVDVNRHDIALLRLDGPVALERFPTRATLPTAEGTPVFAVGSTGGTDQTPLLRTPAFPLMVEGLLDFRMDTGGEAQLEPGDSGGPVVLLDDPFKVIAVHRGGNAYEFSSPVYAAQCWISDQIDRWGGEGPQDPEIPPLPDACVGASEWEPPVSDLCAAHVCATDAFCCGIAWDEMCQEASLSCPTEA